MSQVLAGPLVVRAAGRLRLGLPELGRFVILRHRLGERLEAGSKGLLTVVEAPTGAGKTLGVAGWAAQSESASGVLWLGADAYVADGHDFWNRLRSGLLDLGAGPLPPVPPKPSADSQWTDWLITFAAALSASDGVWVVVLDNYPIGPCGLLGQQIAAVLTRAGRALRLVVTCTGSPAIDVRGLRLAGEHSHIGPDEMRMDEDEIVQMLGVHGVTADVSTVSSICARTYGWACGIGMAAHALQASCWLDVMDELDTALDDLMDRDVLAQFSAGGRELIIRTSVATEVSTGLARAIMGPEIQPAPAVVECRKGFVEVRLDGSFRCHPLLRRAALGRLDAGWPALAREARRAAADWYVGNGDATAGIELAADVDDWSWVARALVRSLAVPSIVLGTTDKITARAVDSSAVGAAEPLIVAAAALSRGNLQAAEAAMARATESKARGPEPELVRRLSEGVVRMAISRQRSDHEAGLCWVAECRQLAAELDAPQQLAVPELWSVLAAHEGAFLLWSGDLDRAVAVLEPAAQVAATSGAEQVAAADCAGLLAWLEASRGNLTDAARHAAMVLTMRPADGLEVGVGYAQLAAAWVHLERGELDQASQRLARGTGLGERVGEPWLAAARRLADARVATAGGEPDAALRLLAAARKTHSAAWTGWLADRFTVAVAEAHLLAGDPQRALAALTPEPQSTLVEARVLAAAARRAIGDRRGARALLTAVEGGVAEAPLPSAVQVWSIQAQLADEDGDGERARSMIGRALRAASREQLRLALSLLTPWLPAFVERNPDLSRSHRTFMASLITKNQERRVLEPAASSGALLDPLTERELQVLERLALLCTTEEIASDLFVSVNTVKTHVKSLFLKLSVNRRADAVRRGRGLALC